MSSGTTPRTSRPADVTVITPTFNSAVMLERSIHSVAEQSAQVLEHIVIDDGSTDNTARVVEELAERYPHLRYFRQRNSGAAVARNFGLERAVGRFVFFLDADDVWTRQKVEVQRTFMIENNVPFSYGDYQIADRRTGSVTRITRLPAEITHADLLAACPIGCLTAAFDRELFPQARMPLVRQGQDWGLWLRLTRDGLVARKYAGVHATYSTGGRSLSTNKFRKTLDVYDILRNDEKLPVPSALVALTRLTFNALKGI